MAGYKSQHTNACVIRRNYCANKQLALAKIMYLLIIVVAVGVGVGVGSLSSFEWDKLSFETAMVAIMHT